jgi:hypothetical protein
VISLLFSYFKGILAVLIMILPLLFLLRIWYPNQPQLPYFVGALLCAFVIPLQFFGDRSFKAMMDRLKKLQPQDVVVTTLRSSEFDDFRVYALVERDGMEKIYLVASGSEKIRKIEIYEAKLFEGSDPEESSLLVIQESEFLVSPAKLPSDLQLAVTDLNVRRRNNMLKRQLELKPQV